MGCSKMMVSLDDLQDYKFSRQKVTSKNTIDKAGDEEGRNHKKEWGELK